MAKTFVKVAGAWVNRSMKPKVAGAFAAKQGWARVAGAWVRCFNHTTTIPATGTGSGNRPGTISTSTTASITSGVGSFTYAWSWQSGGASITLGGITTATCTQDSTSTAGPVDITYSGVLQCVVTDTGNGSTATTTTVSISHTHLGSA